MRLSFEEFCASTANDQLAAATPRSVMKSRRLMSLALRPEVDTLAHHEATILQGETA